MPSPLRRLKNMDQSWLIFWVVLSLCVLGVMKRMRHAEPGRARLPFAARAGRENPQPPAYHRSDKLDYVVFRGQTFKLRKAYDDYDDYKNDPENLDPSEYDRVRTLVSSSHVPDQPLTRDEVGHLIGDLQFPGYGATTFGTEVGADGASLWFLSVEVPRSGKDRCLVFRVKDERYQIIDDFVDSTDLHIMKVRLEGGSLVYSTIRGDTVLKRPLSAGPKSE